MKTARQPCHLPPVSLVEVGFPKVVMVVTVVTVVTVHARPRSAREPVPALPEVLRRDVHRRRPAAGAQWRDPGDPRNGRGIARCAHGRWLVELVRVWTGAGAGRAYGGGE